MEWLRNLPLNFYCRIMFSWADKSAKKIGLQSKIKATIERPSLSAQWKIDPAISSDFQGWIMLYFSGSLKILWDFLENFGKSNNDIQDIQTDPNF